MPHTMLPKETSFVNALKYMAEYRLQMNHVDVKKKKKPATTPTCTTLLIEETYVKCLIVLNVFHVGIIFVFFLSCV